VFAGEVVVVLVILVLARRIADAPAEGHKRLDLVGTLLSVVGLGMAVFGVLRSSEWGWINPKPGGPSILGLSPTIVLIIGGLFVVWLFIVWEKRLERKGADPLVEPEILKNHQLSGGLIMFLLQYLLQAGVFFIVPLFLSVVLELTPLETGARLIPLSIALLIAAAGIPKVWPHVSPRRMVRIGVLLLLAGILVLMTGIHLDANAGVVAIPMLLIGLGIGALASQLGAVTVSAVPDDQSSEVGGLQNTATNLGASLGTAFAGSVMIAVLTSSFIAGITNNPDVPASVASQVTVQLSSGAPFISDTALEANLTKAGASQQISTAVLDANRTARIQALDAALGVLGVIAVVALFFTGRIPTRQPGSEEKEPAEPVPSAST